jgi:hypothetical protein
MPSFSLLALAQDVELLNDSNWHNWKDEILMVLGADGVSAGIVSGAAMHPADQAGAAEWDKWIAPPYPFYGHACQSPLAL